jgi:hypothetical protein
MYRLVGFSKQEQELHELVETEERRRALGAMMKSLREWAHSRYPDRREGHAYYAEALADVKQTLLSRTQSSEAGGQPPV